MLRTAQLVLCGLLGNVNVLRRAGLFVDRLDAVLLAAKRVPHDGHLD